MNYRKKEKRFYVNSWGRTKIELNQVVPEHVLRHDLCV